MTNRDEKSHAKIPLDQWPTLRTPSEDVTGNALVSIYGARKFVVGRSDRPFFAHANFKALKDVSFSYCSYTNPVSIDFPEAEFYRQAFSYGGNGTISAGSREIPITQGGADVIPAGVAVKANFGAGFQQLLLRVDEGALAKKLGALIGATPARKIEFSDTVTSKKRSSSSLHRLVFYVVNELDASSGALPAPALAELEQALLVAFLFTNENNFSRILEQNSPTIAPWQVRQAEEYIEANWQTGLTIESMAEAIGASARSIFSSFSQARGYSPMAFLKATRLHHAREKLQSPAAGITVTGVALECGFQNMGHFAINYRKQFGETPSETLKRTKGAASLKI